VGFPGETESDFDETLEVMREVKFAKVHMFPYSRRERTRAALYPNQVPPAVIQERKQKVLRESEKLAFEMRQAYVGRKMRVLFENNSEGHTDNFLPVLASTPVERNTLMEVECLQNLAEGLMGKVI
jgi:threonylcarbamoyladenosine tRNA methylthiotransferase MtaB